MLRAPSQFSWRGWRLAQEQRTSPAEALREKVKRLNFAAAHRAEQLGVSSQRTAMIRLGV
jgi:hypothetical protein